MAKIIHYESVKTGLKGELPEAQFEELKKHGGKFRILKTADATKSAKTPEEVEKKK